VAQALLGTAHCDGKRGQVRTTTVAQLDPLEVAPDPLVRIKLRRIAGQLLQVQAFASTLAQELFDGLAAMDGRPVPMMSSLPAILRSNTRRKRTTSGEW
jgi:hypothetical protein